MVQRTEYWGRRHGVLSLVAAKLRIAGGGGAVRTLFDGSPELLARGIGA
jgi:hypothetical protein